MKKGKYSTALRSVVGTREEQQDYAFLNTRERDLVAVVCDGMGGLESGRRASQAAVEKFKELYRCKSEDESPPSFFLKAVDILDEYVFQLKNEDGRRLGSGTTLVAVIVENNDLYWLSVGDSRLYILRGSEFVQATRDHNYFLQLDQMAEGHMISRGKYQIEAAKGEALISFIGLGGIKVMDMNQRPFQLRANDTLLLATDGLYKALSSTEIQQCLQLADVQQALDTLIEKASAKAAPAQDNTTCVVIRYEEGESDYETDKMQQ